MQQHLIEKWDSYLGKGLGILIILFALVKPENPIFMQVFNYYIYLMIGVAAFDIFMNFGEHENFLWKALSIGSNLFTAIVCVFLIQEYFGFAIIPRIAELHPIFTIPNFMVYLGIFVIAENILWSYVFDHF